MANVAEPTIAFLLKSSKIKAVKGRPQIGKHRFACPAVKSQI